MTDTESSQAQRFTFSSLQTKTILESQKVKDVSNKYIGILNSRIIELSTKAKDLRDEAKKLDIEVLNLTSEINTIEKSSNEGYADVLNFIIDTFHTPSSPWKALLIMEEGLPIGVDIQPE